jgi:hypothetical protein
MPASKSNLLFNSELSGAVTLKSSALDMTRSTCASFVIVHPNITTTYSVEVSNGTADEIAKNTAAWTSYSAISVPQKTASETFYIELSAPFGFLWARLSMVNASGTGTPVVRGTAKGCA